MTPTTHLVLAYLASNGPCGCAIIGAHLWPERKGAVVAAHGGGDYAAQMLLGRLRKQGLVRVVDRRGSSRWTLTPYGATLLDNQHVGLGGVEKARNPLSRKETTAFLDWCFTTDPDYGEEVGVLRQLIALNGGDCHCQDVSRELSRFVRWKLKRKARMVWLNFPHAAYPTAEYQSRSAHCVCLVDGVAVDFTARQYGPEYPVPYCWKEIPA